MHRSVLASQFPSHIVFGVIQRRVRKTHSGDVIFILRIEHSHMVLFARNQITKKNENFGFSTATAHTPSNV